jgi:hypothetical protein
MPILPGSKRNLDANPRKGEHFCRRAAAGGAHIALFSEMWSIGYDGLNPTTLTIDSVAVAGCGSQRTLRPALSTPCGRTPDGNRHYLPRTMA